MAADATDSNAVVPHRLSDLSDVDAATVTNSATDKSTLVWDNAADEWKAVAPSAASADLTDSSGGTANGTIAAITQAANAGSADVGPVKDAIADIAADLATIKAALRTHGIIAAS